MNLATLVVITMALACVFCVFLGVLIIRANKQDRLELARRQEAKTTTVHTDKGPIVIDEQAIKAAFEEHFKQGGYQYSDDNKQNAYGWFRTGWILMQAHPLLPDGEMPIGSPEWALAMALHAPKVTS